MSELNKEKLINKAPQYDKAEEEDTDQRFVLEPEPDFDEMIRFIDTYKQRWDTLKTPAGMEENLRKALELFKVLCPARQDLSVDKVLRDIKLGVLRTAVTAGPFIPSEQWKQLLSDSGNIAISARLHAKLLKENVDEKPEKIPEILRLILPTIADGFHGPDNLPLYIMKYLFIRNNIDIQMGEGSKKMIIEELIRRRK